MGVPRYFERETGGVLRMNPEIEGVEAAAAVDDSKGAPVDPHAQAEAMFVFFAQDFSSTDLVDGGRALQARGLTRLGMKVVLNPVESRHEKMLRALVTMVSSLGNRVRELETHTAQLEAQLPKDAEPGPENPDGVPDEPQAQEAGPPEGPGPSEAEGPVLVHGARNAGETER
jgi:hypothetical protein